MSEGVMMDELNPSGKSGTTQHLAPVINLTSALTKSLANTPSGKTPKQKKLQKTA
jgi:hypothetical protein